MSREVYAEIVRRAVPVAERLVAELRREMAQGPQPGSTASVEARSRLLAPAGPRPADVMLACAREYARQRLVVEERARADAEGWVEDSMIVMLCEAIVEITGDVTLGSGAVTA